MKKVIKNNLIGIILGIVASIGIGVYAAKTYSADEIMYGEVSLESYLNDLHDNTKVSKEQFCKKTGGTHLSVGAKYECDPGDGTKRNFYILTVRENSIDLIMEHNITEGNTPKINLSTAMKYFDTGAGKNIPSAWKNVLDVDLPSAQAIADAVGNTSWLVTEKYSTNWFFFDKNSSGNYVQSQQKNKNNLSNYRWLFNYLYLCTNYGCDSSTALASTESRGYWTKDLVKNNLYAWVVDYLGRLHNYAYMESEYGIRPVITVLKSNLYDPTSS